MTKQNDPDELRGRLHLSREAIRALPPLDRGDEAIQAIIEGAIKAVKLFEEDTTGPPNHRDSQSSGP